MQDISWTDYQAFLAIARHGQLARAGAAMGVDATTMGRRLRRLEARLGVTLFEQTRQGQLLTEAGEALLASVETMAQAAAAIAESAPGAGGASGTLRLSVSEGFGSWVLVRHIPALIDAHPRLMLDLVASTGFLSPSKREADVAVLLSRPKAGPLIAGKLADYALRLYASRASIARTGLPDTAEALASTHRLIDYIPDLVYAPELRYLPELHPALSATLRSSSIVAQYRMIAAGVGVGVLPCFMGDADPDLVAVLPDQRILRSFWLVTHRDTHNLARVRACKDWLTHVVREERLALMPPA